MAGGRSRRQLALAAKKGGSARSSDDCRKRVSQHLMQQKGTVERSTVALGDSLDLVLLPDGKGVAGAALQLKKRANATTLVSYLHLF